MFYEKKIVRPFLFHFFLLNSKQIIFFIPSSGSITQVTSGTDGRRRLVSCIYKLLKIKNIDCLVNYCSKAANHFSFWFLFVASSSI